MSEAKSNLPAPALPRENFMPIRECKDLQQLFSSAEFRERITSSVPRYMTNERMLSVVLRAHMTNPLLMQATPQSFAGACLTATNTGLEPNSALAEAHLIPFRTTLKRRGQPDRTVIQIQVIFGYQGLLKLASNSGRLLSVSANVVYPSDIFDWMEGSNTFLHYKRGGKRERKPDDRPEFAYFHARLTGGGESMEVWPYGDVLRIRNQSQAYRRAKRAFDESQEQNKRPPLTWTEAPWVKWEDPMARKTMIRAGVKYLPKSVELAGAARLDEIHDRRDIDYSKVIDVAGNVEEPDYVDAAVKLGEGIEDEGTDSSDGAAFTDRREDTQATTQQSSSDQPPASTETPDPGFEHYLIDESGEYDGPFVDPVKWAEAFIALFQKTKDKATLLENNEEALGVARHAPIADQLLAVSDAKRDLPNVTALVVNTRRDGKPDWPDYANRFRQVLFGWRGPIDVWLDAQHEVMQKAPLATRLLLVKTARERAEQLSTPLPEWVASLTGTPTDNSADERWVDTTLAQIKTMTSIKEIEDYAKAPAVQTRMKRLLSQAPNLHKRMDEGFADRIEELSDPTDPEDDPEAA